MAKLIFILEDNADLRDLYGYILEDEDYEIRAFATLSAFMEVTLIPDLYLLDVMLPDGDGVEVCKNLQKKPLTAKIPVIMISAHKNVVDVKIDCPQADFIAKPFDIDELTQKIASKFNSPTNKPRKKPRL